MSAGAGAHQETGPPVLLQTGPVNVLGPPRATTPDRRSRGMTGSNAFESRIGAASPPPSAEPTFFLG